ncbi:hypothetical protein McpSp1_17950 [Methanocorpusculaceae archaeon Sp1]|nr:hypothetical protein [Methanocorpusculaceae archaeon Sp1]
MLVLITAVLVAIVAIAVIGMAGNQPGYVVGVTASAAPSGNNAIVTLYGSKNIPELVKVEVIDAGSSRGEYVEVWNGTAGSAPVGVPLTAKKVARPDGDLLSYAVKLLVKGTFADGTEQVLLMQDAVFRGVGKVVDYILYNEWTWSDFYNNHTEGRVEFYQATLLDFGDGKYVYAKPGADYTRSNFNENSTRENFMYYGGSGGAYIEMRITPELVKMAASEASTSDSAGTLYQKDGVLYVKFTPSYPESNNIVIPTQSHMVPIGEISQ